MCDFIKLKNDWESISTLLDSDILGFREAPEFAEVRECSTIAGVACATFAKYVARLYEQRQNGDHSIENAIGVAHDVIERMASSKQTFARELLTDEVYESLIGQPMLSAIISDLKPHSLQVFNRWKAGIS